MEAKCAERKHWASKAAAPALPVMKASLQLAGSRGRGRLGLLVLSCLGSARAQGLVEQPGFFHQPAEPLPEVYTSDTGASRPAHPGLLVA